MPQFGSHAGQVEFRGVDEAGVVHLSLEPDEVEPRGTS